MTTSHKDDSTPLHDGTDPPDSTTDRVLAVVVGPASCDDHVAHTIGCLNCAFAVCESDDYDLGEFLDLMEHIGWSEESTRG